MKRKINRVGKDTLTVSLPSAWARKAGVRKGDEVFVEETGRSLTLRLEPPALKEKEINLGDFDQNDFDFQYYRLVLNNLYRLGYERLVVRLKSVEQFHAIQELCNNHFLGFEIVRKEKSYCIIENIAEPGQEKFAMLLRRIFLIILESLNMVIDDFEAGNHNIFPLLDQQFNKTEQLANFCMKCTKKNDASDTSYLNYLLAYDLLVLEGELRHMYEYMEKNSVGRITKGVIGIVRDIRDVFRQYYEYFYKKDFLAINQANKKAKMLLYNTIPAMMVRSRSDEAVVLHHLALFTRMLTLQLSPSIGIIQG